MTILNLISFVTVVSVGSIQKAAKELDVSQSTISKRLSGLESSVGARLVNRGSCSDELLTHEGLRILPHVSAIVAEYSELIQNVEQILCADVVEHKSLHVYAVPTMKHYGTRQYLQRCANESGCDLHYTEMDEVSLISNIRYGEADLIFCAKPKIDLQRFSWKRFCYDTMCLLVHKEHSLALSESIHLLDLKDIPLAVLDLETNLRSILTSLCLQMGFMPTIKHEMRLPAGVIDVASDGKTAVVGLSGLQQHVADTPDYSVIKIADSVQLEFGFAWERRGLNASTMEATVKRFLELAGSEFR